MTRFSWDSIWKHVSITFQTYQTEWKDSWAELELIDLETFEQEESIKDCE